jgi:SRSO17 transposase
VSIPQRVSSATPPPSGRKSEINVARRDVAGLNEKLKAYHRTFSPLFFRKEQRQWSRKYMEGQMLDIERKAIEPMARALEGGDVQAMQQFISVGAWDDTPIIIQHHALVAETIGEHDGVAILDGCDFPKQGDDSVGVARQWCGPLGKVANCQAGVVLVYASSKGYTMIDRRLYLPAEWFEADHRERWKKCGIPDGTPFQTKPELGWAMLTPLIQRDRLPFKWVTMDEGFGRDTRLLNRLDQAQIWYMAEVPHSTRGWRRRPKTEVPRPSSDTGRPPTRVQLVVGASKAKRVDAIAKELNGNQWHRFTLQEGTKGPLVADIAAIRVTVVEDGLPGRDEWFVFRRSVGRRPVLKTYRCNAPADTPRETLARMTGMRWPVEQTNEECKTELGMDHYEVRSWTGWHHHMTMTMLSHHFLVQLRVEMGDQAPALTVAQVRKLLNVTLPKRQFDEEAILAEIQRTQHSNHAAYRSHRKRKLRELSGLTPK